MEETLQTARGSHLNKHKPLQTTQLITTPLIQLSKVTTDITTIISQMFQRIKLVQQQVHRQSARLVLPLCKSLSQLSRTPRITFQHRLQAQWRWCNSQLNRVRILINQLALACLHNNLEKTRTREMMIFTRIRLSRANQNKLPA